MESQKDLETFNCELTEQEERWLNEDLSDYEMEVDEEMEEDEQSEKTPEQSDIEDGTALKLIEKKDEENIFKRFKKDLETALNNPCELIQNTKELFEPHTLIENNYDQNKALSSRVLIHLLTRRELQIAFRVPLGRTTNFNSFGWPELLDTVKMRPLLRLDTYIITFFRITEDNFDTWIQWTRNRHAVDGLLKNAAVYCIVNKEHSFNCRPSCSPANFTPSPFEDNRSFAEQIQGDLRYHLKHPEWPLFQCDNLYWHPEYLYFDFSAGRENLSMTKNRQK